jgi:hypothetical protein
LKFLVLSKSFIHFFLKKRSNQNLTVDILENEVDVLRGELRDITTSQQEFQGRYVRDMSALKGLLEQILINQQGRPQ